MKSYFFITGILLFVGFGARAQEMSPVSTKAEGMEFTCRNKAKEAANQAYRSCMFESKSTQIDQVRKDYQVRLNQIKAEYESELARISGKKVAKKQEPKKLESKLEAEKPMIQDVQTPVIELRADDKQDTSMKSLPSGKMTSGRAMLITDGQDIPEPIPVEKLKSSASQQ